MNEFFDNLSKAAKDAAKVAMKVSGDAVELTKASLNIRMDEAKRENLYTEIGKIVHELHKKNIVILPEECSETVRDLCLCVDEIETAINEQKTKAAGISNKKFCVNCGTKVDKSYIFCYSCGAKQPEIIEEEAEEECCCCCDCEGETDSCCADSCCEDESCCDDVCCEDDSCCEDTDCCCDSSECCDE